MSDFDVQIQAVRITETMLAFDFVDGRSVSIPLAFYPTLAYATQAERETFEIIGCSVHWPLLDADLDSECLLRGAKEAPGYVRPSGPHASQKVA